MKIRERFGTLHRRLADKLNNRTTYWNKSSKLLALAFFCLVFGGVCCWLLARAFFINH
jgi:hypothetical protein